MKIVARNKKAKFDYEIKDNFKAGIVLKGYEVKAIKTKSIDITGAYIVFKKQRPYLINAKIPPYQPKNIPKNYLPNSPRLLLLKKREIKKIILEKKASNLILIPTEIILENNLIKIIIALAKHKKKYQKKEKIKERETKRKIERKIKEIIKKN